MPMKQVLIRFDEEMLRAIDKEAAYNGLTRNAMVRRMAMLYLRPGRDGVDPVIAKMQDVEDEPLYADQEEMLTILRRQKLLVAVRAMIKDSKRRKRQRQPQAHTNDYL